MFDPGHSVLSTKVPYMVHKVPTALDFCITGICSSMRSLLVLLTALVLVTARKYSSKHDKIDIDRLVQSPKYMEQSVGCYLDRNDCDKMTATLKIKIPELVESACEKCTPAQKYILRRYLEELKTQRPRDYAAFRNKYDADNVDFEKLEAAIS